MLQDRLLWIVCLLAFALIGCSVMKQMETGSSNDVHSEHLVILDQDSFAQTVKPGSGVVLVDFWAPWCGPCLKLGPTVSALADDYQGRAIIAKVNSDENQGLAQKYGVSGLPTMLIFKDGQLVDRLVGLQPKALIAQSLDAQL
jgi:thioredoxin 1